jgi:hypothetical protein
MVHFTFDDEAFGGTTSCHVVALDEALTELSRLSARQAQVLDLLLNSVYTERPQLSLDNMRAPQTGTAAPG